MIVRVRSVIFFIFSKEKMNTGKWRYLTKNKAQSRNSIDQLQPENSPALLAGAGVCVYVFVLRGVYQQSADHTGSGNFHHGE